MEFSTILYEKKNSVGIITLNRPNRMNAVIEEMYDELNYVFNLIASDNDVRAVVIRGASYKKDNIIKYAFCAGADLKKHGEGKRDKIQKRAYIKKAHLVNKLIYNFKKPVIACLNGHARGAGAEIAICCDFIFIGDEATIAFPETGLGTFIGGGSTYILPRLLGVQKAKELVFTGRVLKGKTAVAFGLAQQSHPIEDVFNQSFEYAFEISKKAPISILYAKKMLKKSWHLGYEDASDLEADAILSCMDTKDWQEGIDAFAEKREPLFKGE